MPKRPPLPVSESLSRFLVLLPLLASGCGEDAPASGADDAGVRTQTGGASTGGTGPQGGGSNSGGASGATAGAPGSGATVATTGGFGGGAGAGTGGGSEAGANTGGAATGGTAAGGAVTGGTSTGGALAATGGADAGGADASVSHPPGWTLVWSDEFDGPAGTGPDAAKWTREVGGHGWGNDELEYYTDRTDNAAMDGDGSLVITARAESYMGRDYTSARLITQGHFEPTYGRFEARIQIPEGQGIWPAFWMLGNDIGSTGWPACGEIDILENIGREPTVVHGTLHGPGYSGGNGIGASHSLPGDAPFADDYHVYAIEWETEIVRWYVDGTPYQTRTPSDLPQGAEWVYDHPFFLILNVAVGGQWPGYPDETTVLPQRMRVDYVRVYERAL